MKSSRKLFGAESERCINPLGEEANADLEDVCAKFDTMEAVSRAAFNKVFATGDRLADPRCSADFLDNADARCVLNRQNNR